MLARSKAELEALFYGPVIGHELAYNGALQEKDIRIVNSGCEILWMTSLYARINKFTKLYKSALDYFKSAEGADKRGGDPDCYALLQIYHKHAITEDWDYPSIPDKLFDKISAR